MSSSTDDLLTGENDAIVASESVNAVFHMTSGQTVTITLAAVEAETLARAVAQSVKVINFNGGRLTINFDNVEYIEYVSPTHGYAAIG